MNESGALDQLVFLARSETRVEILEYLHREGPAVRRELNDHVDGSRSTVTRALAKFEKRDWVDRSNGMCALTPLGEALTAEFLSYLTAVETAEELSAFLKRFPLGEYELELDQLRGAEITVATEAQPHAPMRAHAEPLNHIETYRAILPALVMRGKEHVFERVDAGELKIELVVQPRVAKTITESEFAPAFAEQLESNNLDIYVADDAPEFFLGLMDEEIAQIGVTGEDSTMPAALLESTQPTVREWGETVFTRHRQAGEKLRAETVRE